MGPSSVGYCIPPSGNGNTDYDDDDDIDKGDRDHSIDVQALKHA